MALKVGLVGLPNVGKSTLFNALTKSSIPAENYPFCTVDPHIAITNVPDERLEKTAQIFNSGKIIPATAQFVDIAGLVKGASKGEGLGNKFLGNIMEVDLILHVLRCFEDSDITKVSPSTHVDTGVDPIDDFETICAELMLKDLESITKREEKLKNLHKVAKNRGLSSQEIKQIESEQKLVAKIKAALEIGDIEKIRPIIEAAKTEDVETIPVLSGKNYLIVANLSEEDFSNQNYKNNEAFKKLVEKFGEEKVIPVSAKIESELSQLSPEDFNEMIEELGITESGLQNIIKKSYINLNLITFFTCGPKEAHAWSIVKGTNAQKAAGEIHSDLERGFICAEVYNCADLFELGSEQEIKLSGKLRKEGKDYIVQDGDIVLIRFNV